MEAAAKETSDFQRELTSLKTKESDLLRDNEHLLHKVR
jgi:hypothetical protein